MAPAGYERLGPQGAASSTHYLGTATAMAVLARGGNAFDAAVAAGFVLQVVEPHLCGPGGEVPAVFVTASDPTPRVLCGQGVLPAAATVSRLRDELGLSMVPGTGLLAATVPGAWDGWLTLLRDYGTLRLAEALEPALGYAAGGFPLVPRIPATIDAVAGHFRSHWPSSAATWLPDGRTPRTSHRLPGLAATWTRLLEIAARAGASRERQLDAARDAWYRGFVAEEIDTFGRTPVRDETGRAHAGLLTADDLAGWSASYEPALVAAAGAGWAVAKPGPWSQGPVLAQHLALLLDGDVRYRDGVATAETVHRVTEAAKLAFADREAWYGDSAPVPLPALLSAAYTARRRELITDTASLELRPGAPDGLEPRLPDHVRRSDAGREHRTGPGLGEPTVDRSGAVSGDTVHIDVVDAAGNMISATPSGGWLQSSPTIPALGFCLGTRAQMCWLEPDLPASLVPGRRPRTTLSPSLGLRHGEPRLAFGTPGGDQQDQWQLCFWLAHTVGGLDLQAAIDAPTWHSTAFPASFAPRNWEPGGLMAESRLGAATLAELRRRGHRVTDAGPWALGRRCAVGRGDGPLLRAAADRRSGVGSAAAY